MSCDQRKHVNRDSLPGLKSTERSFGPSDSCKGLLGTEMKLRCSLAECTSRNAQKEKKLTYLKTLFHDLKAENAALAVPLTSKYTEKLTIIAAKTDNCQEEANQLEYVHLKAQQSIVSLTQSVAKHRLLEIEALALRQSLHYRASFEAVVSAQQLSSQASLRLSLSLQEAETARKRQTDSLSAQRQTQKAAEWLNHRTTQSMYLLQKHIQEGIATRREWENLLEQQEAKWKQWKAEKQICACKLEHYERGLSRIAA